MEQKTKKIVVGTLLVIALTTAGCGCTQLHQSLLLHENRRLEDALYSAHAHVALLQRENDLLRKQQSTEISEPSGRSRIGDWNDGSDVISPFEIPTIILPHDSDDSGDSEIPDLFKGSQSFPTWSPIR